MIFILESAEKEATALTNVFLWKLMHKKLRIAAFPARTLSASDVCILLSRAYLKLSFHYLSRT